MMWSARFTLRMGVYRLVLLEGCGSLWRDAVVGGGAVSLDFLASFLLEMVMLHASRPMLITLRMSQLE